MNVAFDVRGGLERLPIVLETIIARINTMWKKEHDPATGGHTDITADSLTVHGDVAVDGGLTVDGVPISGVTPPLHGPTHLPAGTDPIPNLALTNVDNFFVAQTLASASKVVGDFGLVLFTDTGSAVGQQTWRTVSFNDGHRYLEALDGVGAVVTQFGFRRTGHLVVPGPIQERGRTIPLGEWIAVPFNAANFTAVGGGTWTVTVGQVVTNRYTLVGKTLVWTLAINASTLAGAITNLRATIPTPYVIAATMLGGAGFGFLGGWQPIMVQIPAGLTAVDIFTQNAGTFPAGSAYIQFTITFEIN